MTLKEIVDLKDQGYTLDEIERINKILESTGAEDDPKPEDDPEPDPKPEDDPEPDPKPEDDPEPNPDEPDYKKLYEDLKAKTEKKAARTDRGNEDVAQDNLQEAVAAYFKNIFT